VIIPHFIISSHGHNGSNPEVFRIYKKGSEQKKHLSDEINLTDIETMKKGGSECRRSGGATFRSPILESISVRLIPYQPGGTRRGAAMPGKRFSKHWKTRDHFFQTLERCSACDPQGTRRFMKSGFGSGKPPLQFNPI
jgi:hypothetical protein